MSKTYYSESGKTETFWTRHVRTITFLITLGVFLLIFTPIAILKAQEYGWFDTRPEMTLSDVIKLSEQNGYVREEQISKFQSEMTKGNSSTTYVIEIAPYYQFYAIVNNQTKLLTYCSLSDLENDIEIDVLTEDVREKLTNK